MREDLTTNGNGGGTVTPTTRAGFIFAGWFTTSGTTGHALLYADMASSDTPIHPGTIITGNMNLWARHIRGLR
jgi:uncharacterized repeat protein (TIGR02543 family)